MLNFFRARRSNVLIWALMGLLIIGLAGFGIGVGGLGSAQLASVGTRDISTDAYVRALQGEMRAISSQLGRALPMEEARQFGIDRVVLQRLVNDAALDDEAARLGFSTGDAALRDQLAENEAFRGPAGGFDRETYRFALERAGLTPAEFEALLRDETARELVAASVQAPVAMPERAALTILGFLGEERRFDWIRFGPDMLDQPVAPPADDALVGYYKANTTRYTSPEIQQITYASLTPQGLAASIEIPEDELRAAYDASRGRYEMPERRFIDRIGFPTTEEAAAAKARLDAGDLDFNALASERGFSPQEIDQGSVSAAELDADARAAVFAPEAPGIVGPVETALGPSLYRVNAIVAARATSFKEARDELARERALAEANTRINAEAGKIDDLIAGGATLEEIAAETEMELATLSLSSETTGGIADDPVFQALAAEAKPGEETDPATLASGGIVTLRVDAVEPAAPLPLEEIRERVTADWLREKGGEQLLKQVEEAQMRASNAGDDMLATIAESFGVPVRSAGPLNRSETLPEAPSELVTRVFDPAPDGAVALRDGADVVLAQVTEVIPFDPQDEANATLIDSLDAQLREQAADDVLSFFTAAVRDAAGVSLNQPLMESTLARFP